MEKQSGRFKDYHSSCNLEDPALITNRADFDCFLEIIHESDILQWAITQRPNSDWVCVLLTNVKFFVNGILQHLIGCVGISLPTYVKRNKAVIGLEKDHHSAVHRDNLCLFRCLALHLGRQAAVLCAEYGDEDVHDFTGVTLDGVYQPSPSIFQRLDDEGLVVIEDLRYYPYRATFDVECYFSDERLPANSDKLQWSARHVRLTVSVASNVPGHEDAQCYVTNGDSDKLVEYMMVHLITISDAAYDSLLPAYKYVLDTLKEQASVWDEVAGTAHNDGENGKKTVNPYKTLEKQLQTWLHQLPVLGFNSGKYDKNTIKRVFVPTSIHNSDNEHASWFVSKRQNYVMCLSTDKLKILDMVNFLAPGYSYDKYLKAYGCDLQKGHFPYEYMDDIVKLEVCALTPQEAFYSRLKNEGISDEDYSLGQVAWRDNQMKTMRDFLVWYNNRDVIPFLQAIDKQFAFYQQHNIDMFKYGISVPGLTLLYLFKDLPSQTCFTVFNKTNSNMHHLVRNNIVGGVAIIFHRYHEKDITKIRGEETCR